MAAKLYWFGKSDVSEIMESEWPNPREGQHIAFSDNGVFPSETAYLNVGDMEINQDGSIDFVTIEGGGSQSVVTVTGV